MSYALQSAQISFLETNPNLPAIARWSVAFAVMVTKWDKNIRTRRDLRKLSPDQLDDIGVDRLAAHYEASKPFWQD